MAGGLGCICYLRTYTLHVYNKSLRSAWTHQHRAQREQNPYIKEAKYKEVFSKRTEAILIITISISIFIIAYLHTDLYK